MVQAEKRRKILDAAVGVFAEHGFYNSKVAHIARAAGVADGTIYLYFKNKEDLLIQVFQDTMAQILERQERELEPIDDPVERLRTFTTVHFDVVTQSAALAEVVTVELRQSNKFMRATDMKPFGRYLGLIAKIVEDGQSAGVFRAEINARRAARAFFGVLDEFALEWAMDQRRSSLAEARDHILELFLGGLTRRSNNHPSMEESA